MLESVGKFEFLESLFPLIEIRDASVTEFFNMSYIGAYLLPESKQRLIDWWNTRLREHPMHNSIYCDHMTIKFGPSHEDWQFAPVGSLVSLLVVGYQADNYGQAVVVKSPRIGSANDVPHITVACCGKPPVYSNTLLTSKQPVQVEDGPLLFAVVDNHKYGTDSRLADPISLSIVAKLDQMLPPTDMGWKPWIPPRDRRSSDDFIPMAIPASAANVSAPSRSLAELLGSICVSGDVEIIFPGCAESAWVVHKFVLLQSSEYFRETIASLQGPIHPPSAFDRDTVELVLYCTYALMIRFPTVKLIKTLSLQDIARICPLAIEWKVEALLKWIERILEKRAKTVETWSDIQTLRRILDLMTERGACNKIREAVAQQAWALFVSPNHRDVGMLEDPNIVSRIRSSIETQARMSSSVLVAKRRILDESDSMKELVRLVDSLSTSDGQVEPNSRFQPDLVLPSQAQKFVDDWVTKLSASRLEPIAPLVDLGTSAEEFSPAHVAKIVLEASKVSSSASIACELLQQYDCYLLKEFLCNADANDLRSLLEDGGVIAKLVTPAVLQQALICRSPASKNQVCVCVCFTHSSLHY
jgi:hypothetical protein